MPLGIDDVLGTDEGFSDIGVGMAEILGDSEGMSLGDILGSSEGIPLGASDG